MLTLGARARFPITILAIHQNSGPAPVSGKKGSILYLGTSSVSVNATLFSTGAQAPVVGQPKRNSLLKPNLYGFNEFLNPFKNLRLMRPHVTIETMSKTHRVSTNNNSIGRLMINDPGHSYRGLGEEVFFSSTGVRIY